jgi:hypothetical protein
MSRPNTHPATPARDPSPTPRRACPRSRQGRCVPRAQHSPGRALLEQRGAHGFRHHASGRRRGRRMTYAELAEVRRISISSAERLVRRKHRSGSTNC